MARDLFDSAGARITLAELEGQTVLFAPTDHIESIMTSNGEKEAVVTDLVVLSDGNAEHYDVMVFPLKVMGRLRRNINTGRPVLGVIAKGEAKKGQNAPWILDAADEAGVQSARDYLAKNPEFMPPKVAVTASGPVSGGDDRYAAQSVTGDPFASAPAAPATPVNPSEDPFAV